MLAFVVLASAGCSKDDPVTPSGKDSGFENLPSSTTLTFSYISEAQTIEFTALGAWAVELPSGIDWIYFSSMTGKAGKCSLKVTVAENTASEGRSAKFNLKSGSQVVEFTVTQPEYGGDPNDPIKPAKTTIDPSEIPDYDKFFVNSEHGQGILKVSSKFSFARYKSSEHFFVFWAPEFGDDPNAKTVPSNMRVDIDDLLLKAEQYFDTNVNKLGMATLGQGQSMLDDYKMQIYILYQTEWLATGSGYDDAIGALWVNPSTCQPVGSTIAHEIGHSFQYQTYADRVRKQGAMNNWKSGFRYGFTGPDGSGNGGCGYWEQCAQWQAHRDYPNEQFESYNFDVWLKNAHRHFHHEWMRYASYWLQSYWVEKHGVEAYGRIWKVSEAPEDAIMAYTRLFNGNDYSKTREELFDYAARMATYDIKDVRQYANGYQDRYRAEFNLVAPTGEYQIAYGSCPEATGFNVIALEVPENGGTVSVDFRGLEYGAPLHSKDKGVIYDGDGKNVGSVDHYNKVGGEKNMGWRYGFVALNGETRTYSQVGSKSEGKLSFKVPSGTQHLYLVVQGSPNEYLSHGWDENGKNDPQFPYCIKLDGTDLKYNTVSVDPTYNKVDDNTLEATLKVKLTAPGVYERGRMDLASDEICQFFGLKRDEISSLIKVGQAASEGTISCCALNTDGSVNTNANANNGFWLKENGDEGAWSGGYFYFEVSGSDLVYGDHPSQISDEYKGDHSIRPVLVYTKDGVKKTLKITLTFTY